MSLALQPPDCAALWVPAREFTAEDREMHAKTTIPAMLKAVADTGAAGLCCTQLGLGLRIFVTMFPAPLNVVVNPTWKPVGPVYVTKPEKCLTRLDYTAFVRRCEKVYACWDDADGHPHSALLEGNESRVFQHLWDLLNAKPIFPRPKSVAAA